MTDIDLTLETTEDGRRFIALMGERSDVLFNMDHVFYHSVVLMILAVIILGLIGFFLLDLICKSGKHWKEHGKRNAMLGTILLGVVAVGICAAIYWGVDLGLERKLNHIDAELEAIRIRHPEWGLEQ